MVSKAGGQVSTAFNVSIPYVIVFAFLAAVFYASFVVVSTAVSSKMALWTLGSDFVMDNLKLFQGEEGADTFSSRMFTDKLTPLIYSALEKFSQVDTEEAQ